MENQPQSKQPVKPRYIFLGMVVIYIAYFGVLQTSLSEGFIATGLGLAGGIFLVWGIVAAIRQKGF
jgi:hypothetical protein